MKEKNETRGNQRKATFVLCSLNYPQSSHHPFDDRRNNVQTDKVSSIYAQPPKTAAGLARGSSVGEFPPSVSVERLSERWCDMDN